jgi:site-specific DNA-methyltransferase (adenine-specific)
MNKIYFGDNLPILQGLESESVDLIYIDPPFNTGKVQKRTTIKTVQSDTGSRKGFQGKSYDTVELGTKSYADTFDNLVDFLRPRLVEAHRILKPYGSLYFHIDYREVHYCKILLDQIFGKECFLNEIIWAYDYGGRAKSKWPPKHDNILYYVKNPESYIFNSGEIDREQYIAPGLVGPIKAERGKLPTDTWWYAYVGKKPTDTWWQTIVPTNGKERVGYPTQKPRKLLDRIIKASSFAGMVVLDFFAGSGTVGESCLALDRNFILVDNNLASMEVMAQRFLSAKNIEWTGFSPPRFQIEEKVSIETVMDETAPIFDSQYLMLAASITHLQAEFEKSDAWNNSPFEWVLNLQARQKGMIGRTLITILCQNNGLLIDKPKSVGESLVINGYKVALKFSTLSKDGMYKFQQIRKDDTEYVLCLGISPSEAHCWLLELDYAIEHATPQHTSEYWITFKPAKPPAWIKNYGGVLNEDNQALKILKNQTP